MIFRQALASDFSSIYQIEQEAFPSNPWPKIQIEAAMVQSKINACYVLEKGNEILGYLMSYHILNENEIVNFAIKKSKQMCGLGSIMLDYYLDKIDSDSSVFLEVKRTNYPAIKLYLGYGFEEIGIREKYYSNGEDAIVMKKIKRESNVLV